MADYRDIINGTLNSIVNKVKDVAESGTVRGIYDKGTSRAKAYARIAKLTLELNGANEELKKIYTEIGRLYYEQAKDAPEGFFASLFSQIETVSEEMNAKQEEIEAIKADIEASAKDIDVEVGEFDDIVSFYENDKKDE